MNIYCEVTNKTLRETLFNLVEEKDIYHGVDFWSKNDVWQDHKGLKYFQFSGTSFNGNYTYDHWGAEKVSFEEMFETIENYESPITLGDYEVEFNEDGITVGCTPVSKEQIKIIYNKVFGEN